MERERGSGALDEDAEGGLRHGKAGEGRYADIEVAGRVLPVEILESRDSGV